MMKLKQILFEEEIDDGRKVIEKKDIRKELDNVGANKFKALGGKIHPYLYLTEKS